MSSGYLKFTGDYTALKGMGYTFQKLFAANYMSWSKNGVFIFKKGADISHGEYDLYKLVKFLRTNPELRQSSYGIGLFKRYSNVDTNEYEYVAYTKENQLLYKDFFFDDSEDAFKGPVFWSSILVGNELLEQLKELNDLGWYELAEYEDEH